MFSGISWSAYFQFLLFLLFIYYSIVWFKFIRNPQEVGERNGDEELYALLKKAAERIRFLLMVAKKENYTKEQLQNSLQEELQRYAPLYQTSYASSIKKLIITESSTIGSIPFSEEDVDLMWKG